MKDQVHSAHGVRDTRVVSDVAHIEPCSRVGEVPTHVVLLRFVTTEDADLCGVLSEQAANHG